MEPRVSTVCSLSPHTLVYISRRRKMNAHVNTLPHEEACSRSWEHVVACEIRTHSFRLGLLCSWGGLWWQLGSAEWCGVGDPQ